MVAPGFYLSPYYIVIGIFFYGCFALARASISFGLLERPLVIAFLWGLVTGNLSIALHVGVCCELFWIDDLTVGTRVCVTGTLPLLLTLTLIHLSEFGLFPPQPSYIAPVLCVAALFAWLGREGESLVRRLQVREHTRFVEKKKGEAIPGYIFLVILGRLFIVQTAIFCILLTAMTFGVLAYQRLTGELPCFPGIHWGILWLVAALGGVASLRAKRAYGIFAGALGLLLFTFFHFDWKDFL